MGNIGRTLNALARCDALIATIWLGLVAKRAALLAFAALFAIFFLVMANAAGFIGLSTLVEPLWAAIGVAGADLAIALLLLLMMARVRPGRDFAVALELHSSVLAQLAAAAGNSTAQLAALLGNPLDRASRGLFMALASALINRVRPKKAG